MQMLQRHHGRFGLVRIGFFFTYADVLNQKPKRRLLGNFKGALDLVHGGDAITLLDGGDVDGRNPGAPPLVIAVHGRVHGMKGNAGAAKPVGDLAHVLALVVIEVAARGKNLHSLGAAGDELIEQPGMQPLASRIDQSGHRSAHQ